MLSLRFDGASLLRYAERQLAGLLFHEPPRNTRALRSLSGGSRD